MNETQTKGRFITFEGVDGCGKSTQLRLFASELRLRGVSVMTTREPGGTPLGRRIREILLETDEMVNPLAELLLFAADRAQHVEILIKPSLALGHTVISDRFADATAAYQGAGRGFSAETIESVISLAAGGLKPDLTFLYDLPVETALKRMTARTADGGKDNRLDVETADFHTRVRENYLNAAADEPHRFCVIDARRSINEIHAETMRVYNEWRFDAD